MWLLDQSAATQFKKIQDRALVPTADQLAALAVHAAAPTSRIMTMAGSTAEIDISGVLTDRPSFMAMLFGGGNTTYPEIRAALAEADSNPDVGDIVLSVDTGPGGTIAGLFDTVAAIKATVKPVTARVDNLAASATFALVSQADTITASNRATSFGSIGVVVDAFVDPDVISITSTEAPDKRPDITTEEGRAVVRRRLDGIHELFVEAIAEGRGTTSKNVNANFGRGDVLLAEDALSRGMIDSIKSAVNSTVRVSGGSNPESKIMDKMKLQAEHPELFAAVVEVGVSQERDRVGAHLTMGEASGDMKTAIGAINDGSDMTATLQAAYLAAGMNRKAVDDRVLDDADADTGKPPVATGAQKSDASAKALAMTREALGLEPLEVLNA